MQQKFELWWSVSLVVLDVQIIFRFVLDHLISANRHPRRWRDFPSLSEEVCNSVEGNEFSFGILFRTWIFSSSDIYVDIRRCHRPSISLQARQQRRIVTLYLMFSPPLFIFLRWIADSFYFAIFSFGESLCHSIFGRFPFADHLINVNCNCTGDAVNAPRFAIWLALRWVTIPVASSPRLCSSL